MQILGLILIGLVIGVVARLVLPGRQRIGLGLTLLLGVVGALIGGVVASAIGTGDIFELNVIGTIVGDRGSRADRRSRRGRSRQGPPA